MLDRNGLYVSTNQLNVFWVRIWIIMNHMATSPLTLIACSVEAKVANSKLEVTLKYVDQSVVSVTLAIRALKSTDEAGDDLSDTVSSRHIVISHLPKMI